MSISDKALQLKDKALQLKTDFDEVYESGKQEEKEEFWANFWNNLDGYYSYRFCGCGWTNNTFKPIYPDGIIQPTSAERMFNFFNRNRYYDNPLIDMTEFCEHFDFSQVKNASYMFDNAMVKNLIVDLSSATSCVSTFGAGNGGKFENIIFKVTEKCINFTGCFVNYKNMSPCPTTIMPTEDSVIASNITCDSKILNKKSIKSFVSALSPDTTGKTLTLHKNAIDAAFETSDGANDGADSEEWANLIATKSNWTITLST